MYRKVLVPMALTHDVSPRTLQIAKTLCDADGEIVALHVYETPQPSVSSFLDEDAVKAGFEKARALLMEKLKDNPNVTPKIVQGHSARTIIDFARDNGVDCIVMGSHKPGLSDYFLGSTAARVVRHAPCAVHVNR
jgi:nucleotide-binding universal stress UspA family protein